MRLPDRIQLVLDRLTPGRFAEAEARLERAVEEIDERLLELRRSLADALVLRRDAEARRDQAAAEATAEGTVESYDALRRTESALESMERLEATLGAAETELHEQVVQIRDRMAATRSRQRDAEALASITKAARAAEARSQAARQAVDELQAQVATAEGRVTGFRDE